jgi:jouberin
VENRSKATYKLLPHPSFVYSVKFHPNSEDIVCTSCYDKVIRVWSIKTKKSQAASQPNGQILQELTGHRGYINTICFTDHGQFLYSADSVGAIFEWKCYANDALKEKRYVHKAWELEKEIIVEELQVGCFFFLIKQNKFHF